MNQLYVWVHQFVFIIELVTVERLMGNVVMSLFILLLDSQRVLNCGMEIKDIWKYLESIFLTERTATNELLYVPMFAE